MTIEIHANDVGPIIEIDITDGTSPVDISTAEAAVFVASFKGVSKQFTAAFVTDGTDGKLFYVIGAGDFDQPGGWELQAVVTMPIGKPLHSDILSLQIYPNL